MTEFCGLVPDTEVLAILNPIFFEADSKSGLVFTN